MSYEPTPTLPQPMPPMPDAMPVRQIGISAGTAFKAGFFGFFGAFAASLIVAVVLGCVFAAIGAGLLRFISDAIE